MKKGIDISKKDEIIGYLGEGKTYKEIGEILGVSEDSVWRFIKKHDLSGFKISRNIDWETEKEHLRKLYEEDKLSQEEIEKILGISRKTIGKKIKEFGFTRDPLYRNGVTKEHPENIKPKILVCPECGKLFVPKERGQIYCSKKCVSSHFNSERSAVKSKEELLEALERNDWNYIKTGKDFGISDNAIKKQAKKYGIHKSWGEKSKWSDIIDLESAQKKIDELGIKTLNDLTQNYRGLRDKLIRMGILRKLVYPGTNFDSSWEEGLFGLIKDNMSYTSLQHNVILDPECKYVRSLSFDIVLEYPDSHLAAIEIQGPTHFTTIFNDSSSSDVVRERDEVKYQYCLSHDIDLYYFTYEPSLLEKYGYPHYVYTDENLLLEKLKSYLS